MAIEKINIGWLKDYTEKKFAPKTLLSLIFNEDGSKIQEKLRLSNLTVDNKITGSIDKADQLTTTAVGSVNQPVYFKDGIPEEIGYTIAKSVPSDAVFTDTTYSTATQDKEGLMSASDKKKLDELSTLEIPEQIKYSAGAGLSSDATGTTFSHADTSTLQSFTSNNRTYVTGLTFDNYGHVTNYTTGTETVKDFTLSAATKDTIGGVKPGTGLSVTGDGTLNVTISAGTNFELKPANALSLGGVKVPNDSQIKIDGEGNIKLAEGSKLTDTNYYHTPSQISGLKIADGVKDIVADLYVQNATTELAGVMSAADKQKLDGIAAGANNYTLPVATSSILGGIKADNKYLSINDTGIVTVNQADKLTNGGTTITDLSKNETVTYTEGGNILPGVQGVLASANGGTGVTSYSELRKALGIEYGTWTPQPSTETTAIENMQGYYTKIGNLVTATFKGKWTPVSGNGDNAGQFYISARSLPYAFTELFFAGGGQVNGLTPCIADQYFTNFQLTKEGIIYPRTGRNNEEGISNPGYMKYVKDSNNTEVYIAGTISYITDTTTWADPSDIPEEPTPTDFVLYNGGADSDWVAGWSVKNTDSTINTDYSQFFNASLSSTSAEKNMQIGPAETGYKNTSIRYKTQLDFSKYSTLEIEFQKITWPYTSNIQNNEPVYKRHCWCFIDPDADKVIPYNGAYSLADFDEIKFGENVNETTIASIPISNFENKNGYLGFGVIKPNINSSDNPEIQINKITLKI